ncbi:MAG: TRAP transporter small permease [Pararhodobacter sp.]|nr:TRAP transporter small permease [Pararhodobacter sp.]
MRRFFDTLYTGALIAACAAMVAIAVLVLVQVLGRIIDRLAIWMGQAPPGIAIPSLAEFGGFLFVAAACLALPATLRAAGHVRVTLALGLMGPRLGRVFTGLVLLAALGLGSFAAWHSAEQMLDSWRFNTVSFGMVRVPLWIPQGAMTAGFGLLLVALVDELLVLLRGGEPAFRRAEEGRKDSLEGH